ncbi:MAG TPA: hypothetical protein PKA28_10760 [Methylomusa anaerophila]|nr:hypothetical protein [Methylomusa anaerophila]
MIYSAHHVKALILSDRQLAGLSFAKQKPPTSSVAAIQKPLINDRRL